MIPILQAPTGNWVTRLARRMVSRPYPQPIRQTETGLDVDKLFDDVNARYPKIMRRLGE